MAHSRFALRRFCLPKTPGLRTYVNPARILFLKEIYAEARKLDPRSEEYKVLERSGDCWYNYFQPDNSERYGYHELQKEYSDVLAEIDSLRSSIKTPVSTIAKTLVPEYAHQSVKIESNSLSLSESVIISDALESTVFKSHDFASLNIDDLNHVDFPRPHDLLPSRLSTKLLPSAISERVMTEVAELRNHIIVSHWIAEMAPRFPGTAGLDEDDLHGLNALMLKDTPSEKFWTAPTWGKKSPIGSYRNLPISVVSSPMQVFPYPQEVPNLMKKFITWRNDAHAQKELHPLILACQATIYFFSIHPFQDGNGRGWSREDYLRSVSDAQNGRPRAFVNLMLSTQLDMMRTFKWREFV
ncbi:hypothetical protein BU24DRAFT_464144 [Aaosphaeria arxii CBS 175.79]|uniref:Fido domain-containing protein n=1 Tax=Aaosphaeria arxii CBS 175.79 TaxID=1450172 RepID=A0A6A5XKD2_9PLEO|nr:uncharacterized protein BU24DRAFT_464144 [Aaosphaeria arxii CBS 175.79]KAF2013339.1 hypothetical protein BU24DRAFT_464144 [Aaosphaeria arxii CBS 175.79]